MIQRAWSMLVCAYLYMAGYLHVQANIEEQESLVPGQTRETRQRGMEAEFYQGDMINKRV